MGAFVVYYLISQTNMLSKPALPVYCQMTPELEPEPVLVS